MAERIPDSHTDLLERPIYVVLTTMMPDGQPQSTVVWVDYDGEHVLVNSARGRQKDKNMERNPKVTVISVDPENPFRWLEVRGTIDEITEEGAVDHISKLSMKYRGKAYYEGPEGEERRKAETRVIYKIRPTKVTSA